MNILLVLVPLSLGLVVLACWAFFWAVGNGQFDNLDASSWDALTDDPADEPPPQTPRSDDG